MKACVLHGVGDIHLENVEKPSPAEGEVLVRVHAVGIGSSDIEQIYTTGVNNYPLIPGHEFSGQVVSVGQNVDMGWLNQRVGICPVIPCHMCPSCQKGQYELCIDYGYFGVGRNGGFAEYVAVPTGNLVKLPDNVSYEQAAMLAPLAAAVHAMKKVSFVFGDSIFVCGVNIVGLLLLMCLKESGKHVYAVGQGENQRQAVSGIGFPLEDYCDYGNEDLDRWVSERTRGKGADIFYELTGENEMFSRIVGLMAPMGRICLVGKPDCDINLGKAAYEKIRKDQLALIGSWNSVFTGSMEDDWSYALERVSCKKINLDKIVCGECRMEKFMHSEDVRGWDLACGRMLIKLGEEDIF